MGDLLQVGVLGGGLNGLYRFSWHWVQVEVETWDVKAEVKL